MSPGLREGAGAAAALSRWLARRFWRGAAALAVGFIAWVAGLVWFAETIPAAPPAPDSPQALRHTQAIVVLTGGSARLPAALELLAAGRGDKLFVSGVYHTVDVAALLRVSRQEPGRVECCIVLGYAADSTQGNAVETAAWMRTQGYTSLRLVTANYHMRRSLLEFHRALPEADIVLHPVVSPHVRLPGWWQWRGTASLIINEYNKYLLALGRALVGVVMESWFSSQPLEAG